MAHDVFISYSSKDKETAEEVCVKLESNGIKCWIAPRDIQPSEIYPQAIINAISASRLVILIFSSHTKESKDVILEIPLAHKENIPIIPVRLENIPLSGSLKYYLITTQWFDALPPFEKHLEKLPKVVCQLLGPNSEPFYIRRLPIYFLIDGSLFTEGEVWEAMNNGIAILLCALRQDLYAKETAWFSIIAFADAAWQIVPLKPIDSGNFAPPPTFANAKGKASLGAALRELNEAIDRELVPKTQGKLGDFCPLVFILISNNPTDDWVIEAKNLLNRRNRKVGFIILITAGSKVDSVKLKAVFPESITLPLDAADTTTVPSFFRWIDQEDESTIAH